MSNKIKTLLFAAGMGSLAGMRSMSAPALLSRHLQRHERGGGYVARLLSSRRAATALTLFAAAEMAADKTPFIPNRTEAMSLAGRVASGALSGAAVAGARGDSQLGAVLVGSAAAAGSTLLSYSVRRNVGKRTGIPDALLGLFEDAVVVTAGRAIVSAAE